MERELIIERLEKSNVEEDAHKIIGTTITKILLRDVTDICSENTNSLDDSRRPLCDVCVIAGGQTFVFPYRVREDRVEHLITQLQRHVQNAQRITVNEVEGVVTVEYDWCTMTL